MERDPIEELLPWLANDTLAPEEREKVTAYLASHPSARNAVEATAFALASLGGHPAEDALLAVAYDQTFAHRNAVIGHVAGCADCAEAIALARVARATPLDREHPSTGGEVVPGPAPASRRAPAAWRSVAAAAALAIAMGGLGWWQGSRVGRIESPVAPPAVAAGVSDPAPRASSGVSRPMIVAVVPSSLRRRGDGDETVLVLASDRDGFIVDVELPKGDRDVARLTVRLESADGQVLPLSVGPRSEDEPDLVAVPLPSSLLRPATAYELVVADAATGRILDRYLLRTE